MPDRKFTVTEQIECERCDGTGKVDSENNFFLSKPVICCDICKGLGFFSTQVDLQDALDYLEREKRDESQRINS